VNPEDCEPGTRVLYRPLLREPLEFRGTVAQPPRRLGEEWVVGLKDMEPAYGNWRGTPGRTWVTEASLAHVRPYESPAVTAARNGVLVTARRMAGHVLFKLALSDSALRLRRLESAAGSWISAEPMGDIVVCPGESLVLDVEDEATKSKQDDNPLGKWKGAAEFKAVELPEDSVLFVRVDPDSRETVRPEDVAHLSEKIGRKVVVFFAEDGDAQAWSREKLSEYISKLQLLLEEMG
jgi:hypothetical protein